MEDTNPTLKMTHNGEDELVIKFDPLDRNMTWMDYAVLLPWTSPHRMFGWVHPKTDCSKPFMLHGAFSFIGSIGFQPLPGDVGKGRFIPGPQALLPYDMISQVDMDIIHCPSIIWVSKQDEHFKLFFAAQVKRMIFPSVIEPAPPGLLIDAPPPNGKRG